MQHIYDKLLTVVPKESIFVTTSVESSDDIIEEYCKANGMNIFRGDLKNVAGRFLAAAKANHFDYVTRINGDAPFINMGMYANMLDICRNGDYDFITNVKDRTFPIGMSTEILKTSFYEKIQPAIQASEGYKEHVTLYLYEHLEVGNRHYLYNTENPELTGLHLAIHFNTDQVHRAKLFPSEHKTQAKGHCKNHEKSFERPLRRSDQNWSHQHR